MKITSKSHKRTTKLLAILLSVLMILGAMPLFTFAADGDTATDEIVTKWPVAEKEIEFGQYYSDAGLIGGEATIPGEFVYSSTTTVARSGGLGVKSRDIKFVPTDTTVEPVLGKVDVTVVKSVSGKLVGTPTSTPMQIGQKLKVATFVKTGVRLESYALKTSSFKIDWKEPDKVMNTVGTFTETAIVEPSLTSQKGCIEPFEVQVEVTVNEIDPDKVWLEEIPTYSVPYAGTKLGECCKISGGLVTKGGKEIPGTWAWKNPSYDILLNYASTQYMVFTPDDPTACDPIEVKTSVRAYRYPPTGELEIVERPEASDIEYGQPLSASIISGGVAEKNLVEIPGTWAWKEPTIIPSKGNYSHTAVFTPDDSSVGAPIEISVYVNVYAPEIRTKPTASGIEIGQTLADSKLTGGRVVNGSADIPGKFTWEDPTIAPPAGTNDQIAVFNPTDPDACAPIKVSVPVAVFGPEIKDSPDGSDIEVGHKLSESTLTGGRVAIGDKEIPGTWAWKNPETVMDRATSNTYEPVIFTPDDPNACPQLEGRGYLEVRSFTIVEMPKYDFDFIPGDTYSDYPLTGGVVTKGGEPIRGTWAWLYPNDVIQAGENKTRITFEPYNWQDGSTDYIYVTITAEKIPLEIQWPDIKGTYVVGGEVSGCISSYKGTANMPGRFDVVRDDAYRGLVPEEIGGTVDITVTFDPTAEAYETQTKVITVTFEAPAPYVSVKVSANSSNRNNTDVNCSINYKPNWPKHTGKAYLVVDGKRCAELTNMADNGEYYSVNEIVTLTDLPYGEHEFSCEYVAGENDVLKSSTSAVVKFKVNKYFDVTVNDFAGTKTNTYAVGTNVTITAANHEKPYYDFDKWTVEGTELPEGTDLSAQRLNFVMPSGNVNLTASYKFNFGSFIKLGFQKVVGWFIDVLPQIIEFVKGILPQQ